MIDMVEKVAQVLCKEFSFAECVNTMRKEIASRKECTCYLAAKVALDAYHSIQARGKHSGIKQEVRAAWLSGDFLAPQIAEMFGISNNTVRSMARQGRWVRTPENEKKNGVVLRQKLSETMARNHEKKCGRPSPYMVRRRLPKLRTFDTSEYCGVGGVMEGFDD